MTPHYMLRHPAGTTGAGLSRFWAVFGPEGGRTQPRPITVLQPFLGATAPVHGQPNMCATQGARAVPSSMVVEYIHPVSAVPPILVLAVSEPFLEPFLGISAILDRFSLFRATGNPLNTRLGPLCWWRDLLVARAHRRTERSFHWARLRIGRRRSSRIKPGLLVQRHPPRHAIRRASRPGHPPRVLPRQQKRRPGAKSCRSRRGRTQAKRGVCPQAGGCSLVSPSS
jgi:hypothetical protein